MILSNPSNKFKQQMYNIEARIAEDRDCVPTQKRRIYREMKAGSEDILEQYLEANSCSLFVTDFT